MIKPNIQAFAAGWAAAAIRDAMPTDHDLVAADVITPADKIAAFKELERLANQLLAEAMRLEAL